LWAVRCQDEKGDAMGKRGIAIECDEKPTAGRTVLLVEDEAPLRVVIARNLMQHGHRPIAVDSVGDAIAAMTTRLPDVMLLDVNLPDGTGWDVLRWLRTIHRKVAVIICSAIPPSPQLLAEFRPDAVVLKPFSITVLMHLIATSGVGERPSVSAGESAT
jgi:DNA-binding response OmpR family regulator